MRKSEKVRIGWEIGVRMPKGYTFTIVQTHLTKCQTLREHWAGSADDRKGFR